MSTGAKNKFFISAAMLGFDTRSFKREMKDEAAPSTLQLETELYFKLLLSC